MWIPDSESTGELKYELVLGLTDFPGEVYRVCLSHHEGELQKILHIKEKMHNMENYWEELTTLYHG